MHPDWGSNWQPFGAQGDTQPTVLHWPGAQSQGSLVNTIMLVKLEGSRERRQPSMRWIDSIKEAIGMSVHTGVEQGY